MNNCLVTKLKSVVDNNNLIKLNELRWDIASGNTVLFSLVQVNNTVTTLSIVQGTGVFKNEAGSLSYGTELSIPANDSTYYKVEASSDVVISCMTKGLDFLKIDFMNNNGLDKRCIPLALCWPSLTNINIIGWGGTLSVKEICNNVPEPTNIKSLMIQSIGITGNMTDFVDFPNLTTLRFGVSAQIHNTIGGSIDVYAAAVASSRAAGTCAVMGNGIVTYLADGVDTVIPLGETRTITFDGVGGYTIA